MTYSERELYVSSRSLKLCRQSLIGYIMYFIDFISASRCLYHSVILILFSPMSPPSSPARQSVPLFSMRHFQCISIGHESTIEVSVGHRRRRWRYGGTPGSERISRLYHRPRRLVLLRTLRFRPFRSSATPGHQQRFSARTSSAEQISSSIYYIGLHGSSIPSTHVPGV